MKIAEGTVTDRPWGLTLGTVGMRKLSAQVNVRADDGKVYSLVFFNGLVAAAASPLPNDSVTRVALTGHFVSPSQAGEITKRLTAEWDRDEVEVVASAAKLTAEQATSLRKRLTIQRTARTFAIDRGTFEIDDDVTLPVRVATNVFLGAAIFHGVRMNLSEQRLIEDMRAIGSGYQLKESTTADDIAAYEFDVDVGSIVQALRAGTSLAELEHASHRDIEPRTLHAIVYSLVAGGHCNVTAAQPRTATSSVAPPTTMPIAQSRTATPVATSRTATPIATSRTPTPVAQPRTTSPNQPSQPRAMTPTRLAGEQPLVTRTHTTAPPVNVPRTATPIPAGSRPLTKPPPAVAEAIRARTATPTASPDPKLARATTQQGLGASAQRPATMPPMTTSPAGTTKPPPTRRGSTGPFTRAGSSGPIPRATSAPPVDDLAFQQTGTTVIDEQGLDTDFRREATTDSDFGREVITARGTPQISRTITAPRTITERDRAKKEIESLIAVRFSKLEQNCDYFAILGLPFEAKLEHVRAAYVETSRQLNPESLAALGITDDKKMASRVLAQINAAYAVLGDPIRRRDYINAVHRGDPTPLAPRARAGELDQTELAAEAFEKGESALKRDDVLSAVKELGRAVNLAPTNLDYMAMLAWAEFCAASDKSSVYADTRKTLEKAIHRSEKGLIARFYLGRVERMLGHDREAMNHFQVVLMEEPGHKEAQSEVRVLEQRMARGTKPKR